MRIALSSLSAAVLLAFAGSASADASNSAAVTRALGLIKSHGAAVQTGSGDAFVATDVLVDADGSEHVRFARTNRGLPVIGGDLVVHSKGGSFKGASLTLKTNARGNATPKLSGDDAIVAAGTEFGTGFDGVPSAQLAWYARGNGKSMALVYDVNFAGTLGDQTPTDMHYIVNAKNGQIVDRWDNVHTGKGKPGGGGSATCATSANGTAHTLFSGSVSIQTAACSDGTYQMKDLSRGSGYTTDLGGSTRGNGTTFSDADNVWGNYATSDRATAGSDAHFSVAATWDFYKNNFGRSGIANDGKGALSRVHYGRNYVNAFWSDSCFCMTYGDGDGVNYAPLVSLDIAGHEMSHGVTSRSAGLVYSGESGGLNEANSDIFGTLVEFSANSPNDPPDYLIGEKIYIKYPNGTKALRYMFDPIKDGQSPSCYSSSIGSLDVHYSSGIGNRFFYLLAEGSAAKSFNGISHYAATCNGGSVNGVGRDAAGQIWYRALTVYMTSNTNYAGARTATLKAAADLYGSGSSQYAAVAAAWSAVNVN